MNFTNRNSYYRLSLILIKVYVIWFGKETLAQLWVWQASHSLLSNLVLWLPCWLRGGVCELGSGITPYIHMRSHLPSGARTVIVLMPLYKIYTVNIKQLFSFYIDYARGGQPLTSRFMWSTQAQLIKKSEIAVNNSLQLFGLVEAICLSKE